jgi:hypothetical protein
MTKTAQRPTDTVEETRDQQSPRPNRRRRILLMVVAGLTILGWPPLCWEVASLTRLPPRNRSTP